jgi:hypothetical protein
MKNILAIIGLVAVTAAPAAQAADLFSAFTNPNLIVNSGDESALGYLINWKVGDGAEYNVDMGLPFKGTMVKSVTKDEGDTLWFNQTVDLLIQKQSIDVQIDKTTGKTLKELVNGQEQTIDNTPPTIVSQDYTSVTVPAGTFKAIHIVAKTQQDGKDVQIEEWANPKETPMDGSIKMIMTTQGQTITMEMTKFTKMH